MDFDSIISFLFLIAFFILPAIIKQIKARVKPQTTQAAKAGKPRKNHSLFDKIGEKIQQYVKELEEQAKQQKARDGRQASPNDAYQGQTTQNQQGSHSQTSQSNGSQPSGSEWDAFAEDQVSRQEFEVIEPEDADAYSMESAPTILDVETPTAQEAREKLEKYVTQQEIKLSKSKNKTVLTQSPQANLIFKSNPLQNAVIWSEILGKPVGIRK